MTSPEPSRALVNAALIACLAGACGDNQDDAGARRLLTQVRTLEYRNWERAPGWPERRSSSAPHSNEVDIYIDDTVHEVLVTGEPMPEWPVGATIVKDGWDGGELDIIAVMQKRTDGWYYAEYDDDGDPDYSGHPEVCIDCHNEGSDFVRAFSLPSD